MGGGIFSLFKRQDHATILPLIEQHVPQDAVVIDAGAGTGGFTRLFAQLAPQGHVYAFEPARALRSVLSRVIALRKLHNVSLFPMGLGGHGAQSSCPIMSKATHTTLDQFAARHGLKKVNFIRTEANLHVLEGALSVIDQHRPIILLAANDDSSASGEVQDFLRGVNYHIESSGKDLLCIAEEKTEHARWDGDDL